MSDSKASPVNGSNTKGARNLPSWISSRENDSKCHGKKAAVCGADEENDGIKTSKQAKDESSSGSTPAKKIESGIKSSPSSFGDMNFSKLLEGVVFVLSGFVNPERSTLRSQALEMGAEYQPDWNSNCTLLICAFSNTPKFRQVEEDCGTIVSKEWISECHSQRKLVGIEIYLMHAGKPWRRQNSSNELIQDLKSKSQMEIDTRLHAAASTKFECFSPSQVKKWAIEDLNKTVSWLDSQEEKPEASQIKKIAAEGILTCLQDAIDSLKKKQDIQGMTQQWNFIPRVVEELEKLESTTTGSAMMSKDKLCREAIICKKIYGDEFRSLDDDSLVEKKRPKTDEAVYDSDDTIEMSEEDIELAYNTVASKLNKI